MKTRLSQSWSFLSVAQCSKNALQMTLRPLLLFGRFAGQPCVTWNARRMSWPHIEKAHHTRLPSSWDINPDSQANHKDIQVNFSDVMRIAERHVVSEANFREKLGTALSEFILKDIPLCLNSIQEMNLLDIIREVFFPGQLETIDIWASHFSEVLPRLLPEELAVDLEIVISALGRPKFTCEEFLEIYLFILQTAEEARVAREIEEQYILNALLGLMEEKIRNVLREIAWKLMEKLLVVILPNFLSPKVNLLLFLAKLFF
eukprot:TRINITY_DN4422_c0_g1_i1.p1 TRINITY_DN4422_c0_g1~~TRINITY_DN4422_c0_g1_i1.p1  ORF type:complete len:260 (-),score=5.38 TRINITY_DN4422_c0_g1_i1:118-897(-)